MTTAWFEYFGWGVLTLMAISAGVWKATATLKRQLQDAQQTIQSLEHRLNWTKTRQAQAVSTLARESHSALNGITGYAEFVAHNATDPMIQFTGTIVYESSLKLLRTTDVMLDWLRNDADNAAGPASDFSLRACFDSLRRELTFSLQAKSVLLETHVAADIPEHIHSQAPYVQKVVANLTENAIHFCNDGGRVRLHAEWGQDQHVVHIRIEDNGPVLAGPLLHTLLAQDGLRNAFVDSPLGDAGASLVVAHQLARAMGGRLSHTPTLDKGNMFHFFFPLQPKENAA
jgi:signal transduction histidine kinase